MDPITLLAGGALVTAGFVLGRLPSRRRAARPVKPICGCGHHHAHHDPKLGSCNSTVEQAKHNLIGTRVGEVHVPCTCKQYSGPQPIDTFYAPEIAS